MKKKIYSLSSLCFLACAAAIAQPSGKTYTSEVATCPINAGDPRLDINLSTAFVSPISSIIDGGYAIDGDLALEWTPLLQPDGHFTNKATAQAKAGVNPNTVSFAVSYNEDVLFVAGVITGTALSTSTNFEIYFSAGNTYLATTKGGFPPMDDVQKSQVENGFGWGVWNGLAKNTDQNFGTGKGTAQKRTYEAAYLWADVDFNISSEPTYAGVVQGRNLGFDITSDQAPDQKLAWSVTNDRGWTETKGYGTLTLGQPCTPHPVGLVNDTKLASLINIYPNPASSVLTVRLNASISEATVAIKNSLGVTVQTATLNEVSRLDISNLENGIYTAMITSGNKTAAKHFIVNR